MREICLFLLTNSPLDPTMWPSLHSTYQATLQAALPLSIHLVCRYNRQSQLLLHFLYTGMQYWCIKCSDRAGLAPWVGSGDHVHSTLRCVHAYMLWLPHHEGGPAGQCIYRGVGARVGMVRLIKFIRLAQARSNHILVPTAAACIKVCCTYTSCR